MAPNHPYLRRHDDDEYIDEIKISLVPRFKTSDMSGDEWRVSARMQFFRKGRQVWENSFGKLSTAVNALSWFFIVAPEGASGEFGPHLSREEELKICQQPGCSEPSTRVYRFKQVRDCPNGDVHPPKFDWEYVTAFCDRHAHRGDADLEDNDANYEVLGGGNSQASPVESRDVSPAQAVIMDLGKVLGKDDRATRRTESDSKDPAER